MSTTAQLWGDLLQDCARMRERLNQNREGAVVSVSQETFNSYKNIASMNACNLAEKILLRRALAQLDPNHPLLKEAASQKINDFSVTLYKKRNSYTDVKTWANSTNTKSFLGVSLPILINNR